MTQICVTFFELHRVDKKIILYSTVTSLKAVICFCILFTNLHCITRLQNAKQQISK